MERKLNSDSWKNEYEPSHDENISNSPVDSRPPQLSQQVPGHGQSAQGCQDMGEGGDNNGESDLNFNGVYAASYQNHYNGDDNISEDGNERDSGQEGVEQNQLRPRCDCTCHLKMTHDGRLVKEPCNVGFSRGHSVTSSLLVGQGSNSEQSPAHSMAWGPRSQTPSEYSVFMGEMFPNDGYRRTPTVPSITHSFLSLAPELNFARSVDGPFYYPMDISIHVESDEEDEFRRLPF